MKVEQGTLDERIKMLETLGLDAAAIQHKIPNVLPPVDRMVDAVTFLLHSCRYDPSIFAKQPVLLGFQKSTLQRKHRSLRAAGITHSAIQRAPELLTYDDERVKGNLAVLEERMGLSRAKIMTCPWLLNASVENVVLPKIGILERHGLPADLLASTLFVYNCPADITNAAIEYVASRNIHPQVFCGLPDALAYSVENNLKPKIEYMVDEVGCSPMIFERLPNLLGLTKKTLQEKVVSLKGECDFGPREFMRAPNVLGLAVSTVKRRLQVLYGRGIEKETIRRFPTMLTLSDANIEKKIDCVTQEFGLTVEIFNAYPSLISLSLANLRAKFSYFTERGYSKEIFEKMPMLFALSMDARIAPRMAFLDSLGIRAQPGSYLGLPDGKFCEHIAHVSQESYQEFRKAHA